MSDTAGQIDELEEGVRRFQAETSAAYARLTPATPGDIGRRRQIAEQVREPWAAGGPLMAERLDMKVGARDVRIRIHRPSLEPDLPILLYVHGGGWVLFSLDTHDRLMREYAARANVTVIGIDYSRAPEAKFPTAIEEIVDVVAWLRSPEGEALIGSGRAAIGGDSAGANLSVATCLALRDRDLKPLDAMLLNYGAFDTARRESHARYGGDDYTLTPDEMDAFWTDYLGAGDHDNPLARPMQADLTGLPPAYLCVAECDILLDENLEMARRLAAASVPAEIKVYPGATHSFLEAVSISPLAARALGEASQWLSRRLRA